MSLNSCKKQKSGVTHHCYNNTTFIISHLFTLLTFLFLHKIPSYWMMSFHFEALLLVFLPGRYSGNDFLRSCLPGSTLTFEGQFCWVLFGKSLVSIFFFFFHFEYMEFLLSAGLQSFLWEPIDNLTEERLCGIIHFSLAFSWLLCHCLFSSFITMCLIVWSLCIHQTWSPLNFLDNYSYISSNLGRFQTLFFSNILFFLSYIPVWVLYNGYVGPLVGVLQVFKLCSLFFSLFALLILRPW